MGPPFASAPPARAQVVPCPLKRVAARRLTSNHAHGPRGHLPPARSSKAAGEGARGPYRQGDLGGDARTADTTTERCVLSPLPAGCPRMALPSDTTAEHTRTSTVSGPLPERQSLVSQEHTGSQQGSLASEASTIQPQTPPNFIPQGCPVHVPHSSQQGPNHSKKGPPGPPMPPTRSRPKPRTLGPPQMGYSTGALPEDGCWPRP